MKTASVGILPTSVRLVSCISLLASPPLAFAQQPLLGHAMTLSFGKAFVCPLATCSKAALLTGVSAPQASQFQSPRRKVTQKSPDLLVPHFRVAALARRSLPSTCAPDRLSSIAAID